MAAKDVSKLLELIASETDVAKLKNWMKNARNAGAEDVHQAAFRRVCTLAGREFDDVLDREFQEIMKALETALTEAKGKTTRLNRTRQKLDRVGVRQLLADLAMKPSPSDGFLYLVDFGMADMSAEALIIRHKVLFEEPVVEAAKRRLDQYGIRYQPPN